MIKFLRLENGNLVNMNDIKGIVKSVRLYETNSDGVKRVLRASIELQTSSGILPIFNVRADAPMREGESWSYATEGGSSACRKIDEILDMMVTILVDKMNDEHEKIIGIGTRFLEGEMQAEVNKG